MPWAKCKLLLRATLYKRAWGVHNWWWYDIYLSAVLLKSLTLSFLLWLQQLICSDTALEEQTFDKSKPISLCIFLSGVMLFSKGFFARKMVNEDCKLWWDPSFWQQSSKPCFAEFLFTFLGLESFDQSFGNYQNRKKCGMTKACKKISNCRNSFCPDTIWTELTRQAWQDLSWILIKDTPKASQQWLGW